jgi:hypothetical protein
MTITDDSPNLEEWKVYLEILEFSRASKYEMNTETCVKNIFTIVKLAELRVII